MFKFRIFIICLLSIFLIGSGFLFATPALASSSVKLADDGAFTNVNGLSVNQIQDILRSNNSFLKDYKQGGRSAAQIIYDAAHGHGDASMEMNGIDIYNTINPAAILAMLQKEQSLITMTSKNQDALNVAMGYACPDSGGCNKDYKGFTKQVENGAWQLRYNYERAAGHGFKDYQVGQTIKIDGKKIKIGNRTTAALYRYTPHDGKNFTKFFTKWNKNGSKASNDGKSFYAVFSKITGLKKTYKPGQTVTFTVAYKNSGNAVWYKEGENAVKLGTQDPQDGNNILLNNASRVVMRNDNVKKNKKGLFVWTVTMPQTAGTYTVTLRPVAEKIAWFGPAKTFTVVIK